MTDLEILQAHQAERTPCECWTRVMGYFRPYSHFNKGKKSEFQERQWFTEDGPTVLAPCKRHAELGGHSGTDGGGRCPIYEY